MAFLKGQHIVLRALEPEDLDFLLQSENNEDFWEVSGTMAPFSKFTLKQYIANAGQTIYEALQQRFVIEVNQQPIGMIDLFDFNPVHHRAGIGILVLPEFEGYGYAKEALALLIHYSFNKLQLHQLYANITSDNLRSIQLFSKLEFQEIACKKDWIYSNKTYKNELLFQLINTHE
ncbi:MAG: GNAT family N-acetyltransferase [Flavobacteriaceae bacterium]|nr:MAG: GNAT family N-acetyltransferase [Flavobacteriaceae bacterium]